MGCEILTEDGGGGKGGGGCLTSAGGGGGKGRPTIEADFLGNVLDRDGSGRLFSLLRIKVTGESGAEPLRMFFLGGATGVATASPLGGKAGGLGSVC